MISCDEVYYRLSVLRFMPRGQAVSSMEIHRASLIFLRMVSSFLILLITRTYRSSMVWLSDVKWAATGFSVLLCLILAWWLFILSFKAWSISPTY